jgi:asparagine synthase (glutamine-hydrolysing)
MCGIYGTITKSIKLFDSLENDELYESIKHRGPDDCGVFIESSQSNHILLGHVRLSILDLSDSGHQPMFYNNDQFVIVYNGEIYNYHEIRSQLITLGYSFISNSDTEVLLAAWKEWGILSLKRLIGMFSFVIFDKCENEIYAVRDAFGIKPLFFHKTGDTFHFASDVNTLLKFPNVDFDIDSGVVFDYLAYASQNFGNRTFIKRINQLMPSEYLKIDLKCETIDLEINRWWTPSIQETKIPFHAAVSELRRLFLDSVRYHLVSDVPVGISLSGGIDSSAIACAVRYLDPNIDIYTFSFISSENTKSEEKWIDVINDEIKAKSHKVRISPYDILDDLDDLIKTQGEPFVSTSMYAQYRIYKIVRDNGIKVVLEGQGADELLGGYDGFPGFRMLSFLRHFQFYSMFTFAKKWRANPFADGRYAWFSLFNAILPEVYFDFINYYLKSSFKWLKYNTRQVSTRALNKTLFSDYSTKRKLTSKLRESLLISGLQPLLRYGDRNAMRFSVENRVPFLTIPLVEFILSLPESYIVSDNAQTKYIFREAMRGIVPDVILDRTDKIGFETPIDQWLKQIKKFSENELVLLRSLKEVNFQKIQKVNQSSIPFRKSDWRLINILKWINLYSKPKC